MHRPRNAASAATHDSAVAATHAPDDCEDSLRASVDADAPIVDQAWTAPLCETPGCDRMPNESHRYCCKECKRSRGQRHTPLFYGKTQIDRENTDHAQTNCTHSH